MKFRKTFSICSGEKILFGKIWPKLRFSVKASKFWESCPLWWGARANWKWDFVTFSGLLSVHRESFTNFILSFSGQRWKIVPLLPGKFKPPSGSSSPVNWPNMPSLKEPRPSPSTPAPNKDSAWCKPALLRALPLTYHFCFHVWEFWK